MTIRYGFIACGAINQRRHLPEVHSNPHSAVVAVCDINAQRAAEVGAKYGAEVYTDYRKMLKQATIDAVVIASPNYLHAAMTVAALDSKCHVLVEKPMATSRQEGQAILKAVKRSGKLCMVGHSQRFMPPHLKAKELLERKVLGKIIGFRSSLKHSGPDNWSVDGRNSWFLKRDQAVMGAIGDMAVHKADLLRWLLAEEFKEVSGFVGTLSKRYPNGKMIDVDDTVAIALTTQSGIIGTIEASWTNFSGEEDNATTLYGERGVMSIGTHPEFGVTVSYYDGTREAHAVGAIATNKQQTRSGVTDALTDCILKRKQPPIDAEEGYRSMMVVVTAMQASARKKTLPIIEPRT